jgi:hypothetical protein
MRTLLFTCLTAFALWVAPITSFAACGLPNALTNKLSLAAPSAPLEARAASAAPELPESAHPSITGLWDIKFYSGGQLVDEGFDAWHSDGLELLNDTPPPATGNVCVGVYAQTGQRTFKLKHPSWIFDSTNTFVIGTATIRETVTVDRSGDSFGGTFTIDAVDTFGNVLGHTEGTIKATRIKAD